MREKGKKISRRDFLKTTGAGLAGAGLLSGSLSKLAGKAHAAVSPPDLAVEKDAVLRVLRWSPFVGSDKKYWEINTKKWEKATGRKVITEYLSWEDVRPKAAMEASVGAGHDIVLGWHDDPHLYPDKLLDVTDVAEYLGAKYGGWESVCFKYGIHPPTGRWIALPMGAPGQQIVYRQRWVKEAGYDKFPTDTENFIKLCKKLKRMGHPVGFAMGHAVGDGNNWVHTWLWSFGAKTVHKDGSVAIKSSETRMALETMKELYDDAMIRGVASWLDPHNNKAFLANQISVTNNGISIYYAARQKFSDIAEDLNHASLPIGPAGKPTELHLFDPAFIFKHTPFPNAAKHYMAFMLEEPQCGPWTNAMRGYVTPGLKAYRDLPVWTEDPKHTPYRDCVKNMLWNGYEGPIGPASAAVMAEYVVVDLFANVCARGISIDKAIRTAEKAIARYYK
ncbi:MAG: extracellular solute-binding protein [Deltaproteobacteria bacterium]|nr:extracellular solute-binding protein [Deltaproteobacteria bacterium]